MRRTDRAGIPDRVPTASTLPASASFPASFLIQQNNNFFIAGAAGAAGAGASGA